ncbi:MAG: MaoC domain protein dehydratase [Firmicutes bacterium]|nr:MaoC domain protein dehydratase [Bacillota bacterium]
MIQDIAFAEVKVGETASMTKTISEHDIYTYAGLTGDFNPIHVNSEFAKQSSFGERIAHGLLVAGLFSAIIGTRLPGANTVYLKQELKFKNPVKIGDTVTARVEVLEKIERANWLIMRTLATNQNGVVLLDGKATIMKK